MKRVAKAKTKTTGPELWTVLARAYGSFAGYLGQCVAAEDLCLSDFGVLEALLHKGPMTMGEIAGKVLLAPASMTSAVDRLGGRGLVERGSHATDRRVTVVSLTEHGRGWIAEVYARHARDIEAVMAVLDEGERAALRSGLKKLGKAAKAAAAVAGTSLAGQ